MLRRIRLHVVRVAAVCLLPRRRHILRRDPDLGCYSQLDVRRIGRLGEVE